ncbi:MAG: hypothetical protein MN733_04325 [Nitrososphaera sp.]|nr:hypothetical protein [Nitrososphaera sp.]
MSPYDDWKLRSPEDDNPYNVNDPEENLHEDEARCKECHSAYFVEELDKNGICADCQEE